MSLEQLTLSDEQVQDIVGSLINGSSNADVVYDDANDTLTVSLPNSISVNSLEVTQTLTDPSGNGHSVELADIKTDVTSLSGSGGSNGQIIKTDGTNLAYANETLAVAESNDLTEISRFEVSLESGRTNLLNISGSGILLFAIIGDGRDCFFDITVDGGQTNTVSSQFFLNNAGNRDDRAYAPPIKFDSSLKIVHDGGGAGSSSIALVKQ